HHTTGFGLLKRTEAKARLHPSVLATRVFHQAPRLQLPYLDTEVAPSLSRSERPHGPFVRLVPRHLPRGALRTGRGAHLRLPHGLDRATLDAVPNSFPNTTSRLSRYLLIVLPFPGS